MNALAKHTEYYWHIGELGTPKDEYGRYCPESLKSPSGKNIIVAGQCQWEGCLIIEDKSIAEFIVKAVNNHEALKESLRDSIDLLIAYESKMGQASRDILTKVQQALERCEE